VNSLNETDIGDAIRSLVLNLLSRELHTCMPGAVTKVYTKGASHIVDVKPLLKATQVDGAQAEYDIVQGALLITPGTIKSSVIMPVNVGDLVLLIFSEKALENWGLSTQTANGIYGRQFDLSDVFAIPMNFNVLSTSENTNNADMIIKHESQTVTIKANGNIEIGGTDLAALVKENFLSHTHVVTVTVGGVPGTGTAAAAKTTPLDKTGKVIAQ
jgi:hypothetical protein